MVKNLGKRLLPLLLAVILIVSAMPINVFAAKTVTVLDGAVSITDSSGKGSVSDDGTYTATASPGLFSAGNNTITIYNESGSKANLSFYYTVEKAASFTINGASAQTSGTYMVALEAGSNVVFKITTGTGALAGSAKITMENFSLVAVADSSKVTFNFDSANGSVTVSGTNIAAGDVVEVTASGAELVATPVSGATFLGWVDVNKDNEILSTSKNYTIVPSADMTVKAVFVGANSDPHFMIGSAASKTAGTGFLGLQTKTYHTVSATHIYDNLTVAAKAASENANSKYIILANSGTLPAGDYTIPAGITLLIPFDSANTLFTTEALSSGTYTDPTPYRTLTMAEGAHINIEGAMSLSAKHRYATGSAPNIGGTPVGPVSFVDMAQGSSITVKNGGSLYAYGFITGDGTVTAKRGATVYEYFQIMDFRGGTQSTDKNMKKNGVFPISQYYVQNIEVPLTLEYGSTEYAYTSIYMSSAEFSSAVAFIASSNAMFKLTSGSVTKRYDGSTDRLRIEANGDMTVSGITMDIGTSDINSSDYELPVNNNITVTVNNGDISIGQDMALLPGSEIIIGENAKCVLGSGNNVYVYDADEWVACIYNANSSTDTKDAKLVPVKYAPGRTYNRTEADLVDAKIQVDGIMDASNGYVYTTNGGANIFSSGTGVAILKAGKETVTHQLQQVGSTYVNIPITPAKLKNADGTYLETANADGVDTYTYSDGKWNHSGDHKYTEIQIPSTCIEDGVSYNECSICHDKINETIIPASEKNHNFVTTEKAPTCTESGYIEEICSHCGKDNSRSVEALGHNYNKVVTEPTCIAQGFTTYTCTVCGDSYVGDYVDALGHDYGEWSVRTDAGCESEGIEYRTCSVCGNEETQKISAKGHNYNKVVTAPTCTVNGYTTYTCSVCNHSYVGDEVDALGHSHNEVVTKPTCTEQGFTTHTCSACGDSYVDNYVDATGHSYGEVVTDPTCTAKGYTTYTCSVCNHSYVGDEVDALGHSHNEVVTKPTCTEQGFTTHTCSACGDSYVDNYVDATGHSYGEVVTDPTCTEQGYTTHTCSACGDSYVDNYVDATGHSYGEVVTDPTCTEQGFTTHTCHCGDSYVDSYVDALGHSYGEWEVVTAPTHTKVGEKIHKCDCGHTETAVIPVIICDIDEAGVGAAELTMMRKFILGTEIPTDAEMVLFDMNDDGKITLKDLVNLKKYIANLQPTA